MLDEEKQFTAAKLRALADGIEAGEVLTYGLAVINADGSFETGFHVGYSTLLIVGAVAHLNYRINAELADMDRGRDA